MGAASSTLNAPLMATAGLSPPTLEALGTMSQSAQDEVRQYAQLQLTPRAVQVELPTGDEAKGAAAASTESAPTATTPSTAPVPAPAPAAAAASSQLVMEPNRYTKPDAIWSALKTESVRLMRMTSIIELAEAGGILPRRQEIEDAAFVGVEELQRLYGEGNRDGVLPIATISFCWDEAGHPDPRGVQLGARALRRCPICRV